MSHLRTKTTWHTNNQENINLEKTDTNPNTGIMRQQNYGLRSNSEHS